MDAPLRVLIVEDSEDDAQLLLRELRNGGYEAAHRRVEYAEAMAVALSAEPWDIVICDYSLPRFDAPAALQVLKDSGLDLPFIIVSGAMGEDAMVEAMRSGAHDFLTKDRLARLVPAVDRELAEAALRQEKREADEALRRLNARLEGLNAELERCVVERTADLESTNQRLAGILEVTDVALADLGLDNLLSELLVRLRSVLMADTATILLLDATGNGLLARASSGLEEEVEQETVIPVGAGIAGAIASTGEPVIVEDLSRVSVASPLLKEKVRSLIGAPLRVEGRIIGVIHAGSSRPKRFTEDDLYLIRTVADRAASAIERARAQEERERLLADVEQLARAAESNAAQLEATLASAAHGVLVHTRDGQMSFMNAEAERILGYSREVWNSSPGDREKLMRAETAGGTLLPEDEAPTRRALRGETVRDYLAVVVRGDGERVWLSVNAAPIQGAAGEVLGTVTSFADVTGQYRMQEEVQRRAAELEATVSAVPDGLVINGPSGEILLMNEAAERLFGYAPEQRALPMTERVAIRQFETGDGKPMPLEQFPAHRALKGETVQGEVFVFRSSSRGTARWLSISAAPVRRSDGTLLGAVTIVRDVTEQHELQERQADLTRMISHDLRNPLTAVQGHAQYLLRALARAGGQEKLQRSAESIFTGARRMDAMIQDLVDMVRSESGQLQTKPTSLELGPFVEELRHRFGDVLDTHRIRVDIPSVLAPVWADPNRLERTFVNLMSNALKYSDPGTEVVVSAELSGSDVVVSVADSGAGISAEDIDHIFDRFYRTRGARKTEGLGLGLYITRMMVEAMGGQIWVKSETGQGSTFSFSLPIRPSATGAS